MAEWKFKPEQGIKVKLSNKYIWDPELELKLIETTKGYRDSAAASADEAQQWAIVAKENAHVGYASEGSDGLIRLATEAEALEGFDNSKAMTPLNTSKVVYDNIGRVVQLSFNGVLEDNVITFKPTEGGSYDIRQGYEYEIDLLLEAVGDIDNPSMIILNGGKACTILNAIHTDPSGLLSVSDLAQVQEYDVDTGFRWIFRAKYVELQSGFKVFYMERPVARIVKSVNAMSTDAECPSAKLFYDTVGDVEELINAL